MSILYCYIYPDFADFEVTILLHRLHNAGGYTLVTLAETEEAVVSQSGLRYLPDKRIQDADAAETVGLILPGGPVCNEQNAILPLVRQMDEQKKLLAAICFGPQFLGRAGVLDSHTYTTSCAEETIRQLGVADPFPRRNFRQARVWRDGHVITAQGHAPVDFAACVCRYLGVYGSTEQEYRELWKICDTNEGERYAQGADGKAACSSGGN